MIFTSEPHNFFSLIIFLLVKQARLALNEKDSLHCLRQRAED